MKRFYRHLTSVMCASFSMLGFAPMAAALEYAGPAVGVHWAFGGGRVEPLRVDAGMFVRGVGAGDAAGAFPPASSNAHPAQFLPLWSQPVGGAFEDLDPMGDGLAAGQKDQKKQKSGVVTGVVLVTVGVAALVVLAKRSLEKALDSAGEQR